MRRFIGVLCLLLGACTSISQTTEQRRENTRTAAGEDEAHPHDPDKYPVPGPPLRKQVFQGGPQIRGLLLT